MAATSLQCCSHRTHSILDDLSNHAGASSSRRTATAISVSLLMTFTLTGMAPVQVRKPYAHSVVAPLADPGRVIYPAKRLPRLTLPHGGTMLVKSVLRVRGVMTFGDYVWNDSGIKPGLVLIRIDLDRQLVSVFRGGHEIGTALVIYGAGKHPTPHGTLRVLGKVEHYRSHKYGVPMEYTLWLNTNGIAIHASDMGPGYATRGCIGVPIGFARHLFDVSRVGDSVNILSADSTI